MNRASRRRDRVASTAANTVSPMFERAQRLHRDGFTTRADDKLREARTLYERVLALDPAHVDARHFLGVLLHQTGDGEAGVAMIRSAIDRAPHVAAMHNNLGNVLRQLGCNEEARASYVAAVLLAPDDPDAHNNLGVTLRALGRTDEAERAMRTATTIAPGHAAAHYNLGHVLAGRQRWAEAVASYTRALAIDPKHADARRLLGTALHANGQVEEARAVYEAWCLAEPMNPVARHSLAAVSGENVPARADDAYVKVSFDRMADWFDAHLGTLGYRAPALVGAALARHVTGTPLAILDAGCGTGLCAPLLRPRASRLTGVDLSAGMLARARVARGYDELHEAELTAFLDRHADAYDVVVSADTLCYFGDLAPPFAAAHTALRPGGSLVFTVEAAATGTSTLHPHGRYSHAAGYIRDALANAGFDVVEMAAETLRMERGAPVGGLVVTARRVP